MLRNRLIFSLIYSDGVFSQSRNFRLQRVGDLNWLERNYHFERIAFSIDELVIVDASKTQRSVDRFVSTIRSLARRIFVPIAVGGGIASLEAATQLFENGASKVVINSLLVSNPNEVRRIVETYGSQSVIASVDYRLEAGAPVVFVENGTRRVTQDLSGYLANIQALGVGEILLNSIDKDGTGFGYDTETIEAVSGGITVPLIIMGGAGNYLHLKAGLALSGVSAVATANLFNFIGNGLPDARKNLINEGKNLADWAQSVE